jgi:hypothetical protein
VFCCGEDVRDADQQVEDHYQQTHNNDGEKDPHDASVQDGPAGGNEPRRRLQDADKTKSSVGIEVRRRQVGGLVGGVSQRAVAPRPRAPG